MAMQAPAKSYSISPSNDSTLALEVCRTGLSRRQKHILFFEKFSGEMHFAENDAAGFKISLTIDTNSVVCRDGRLSEKKRREVAEFARRSVLAADTYPEIRFTSNSIRAKELRGCVVEGLLQVRGTAAALKVGTVLSRVRKDCVQIEGDATLRLSNFGLVRPSAMFGLIGTKDEVEVRLLLWGIPEAEVT